MEKERTANEILKDIYKGLDEIDSILLTVRAIKEQLDRIES